MKQAEGVVLLSHCGFSFMEDLIAALKARRLESYVLSSLPLPEHQPGRLRELADKVERLQSTAEHALTQQDIDGFIERIHSEGLRPLCCITVWEGYRHLMAYANARLGVADLGEQQVLALRDKLELRNRLADAGLSRARATALTPDTLDALKRRGRAYFIKPVSGIASYGAFPLRSCTEWAQLEAIIAEAGRDTLYRSIFGERASFLAEDYVPGREYSFEIIVHRGTVRIVAIHEKCELTEAAGTVLEDSCISPPLSLSPEQCADGIAWTRCLFERLTLAWGCFHVEARHDGAHWDLIEINPRVGGSLISHSVKAMHAGHGMLELWLDALLSLAAGDEAKEAAFQHELERLSFRADGTSASRTATYFRVYFAQPGRIARIALRELDEMPTLSQILLKPGDRIEHSSREVFLGQLLWTFDIAEREARLARLAVLSATAIDVAYEPV